MTSNNKENIFESTATNLVVVESKSKKNVSFDVNQQMNPENKSKKSDTNGNNKKNSRRKIIEIIDNLANPSEFMKSLDEVIVKSIYDNLDEKQKNEKICKDFNQNRKTIMRKSLLGSIIPTEQFLLVSENNVPELVMPSKHKMKLKFSTPKSTVNRIGLFSQTDLCFGAHGSYVLNVPALKYAKGYLGNTPVIYGPGTHVVHCDNFKKIKERDLVDISELYICHENIHIIRIPHGKIAKITIGHMPFFLVPREDNKPYVFKENIFNFDARLVDITSGFIEHGNYRIFQIPNDKIAKVWFGSKPAFLTGENDPLVFDDPSLRFEKKDDNELFENTSEPYICHGSLKRIIPKTGQIAITYENGTLRIYYPEEKPILIDSNNHSFNSFLKINLQTIQFPSQKTVISRRQMAADAAKTKTKDDDLDMNEINYNVYRTCDGLPIGVKLLVVFEIEDPETTLKKMASDDIIDHIEKIVEADMGSVIQESSSTDFLRSNDTTIKNEDQDDKYVAFFRNLQDKVKNKLREDFKINGIRLEKLTIETPKVLLKSLANKIAEFSLLASEVRAKENVLDKKMIIAEKEAKLKAIESQIANKQENDNIRANALAKANAEREIAKTAMLSDREKKEMELNFEKEKRLMEINIDKQNQEIQLSVERQKLEILEKRAKIYNENPNLYEKEMLEIKAKSVSGINTMVLSPECANTIYPYNLFPASQINEKIKNNVPRNY